MNKNVTYFNEISIRNQYFFFFKYAKKKDDFLALQDGVLIALVDSVFLKSINFSSVNLYVIKEDVYARGIHKNISNNFILISYIHFVSLTIKNKKQMNW